MPTLGGHVQRGDTLAVADAAEGGFLIYVRAVLEQPARRLHSVADRGPDQRRATIWIGVEARAGLGQTRQDFGAPAFTGPDKGFVEDFLWIRGRLPVRESTVRPIKSARCTSLGSQLILSAGAVVQQFHIPKAGRNAQI